MMPVDPRMLINALRQQPTQEPMGEPDPFALPQPVMQLAAGDGASAQTKGAIRRDIPDFYGPAPAPKPIPGYTPGTDAFKGGKTLRPGYEAFGPMTDAEFAALMQARRKK